MSRQATDCCCKRRGLLLSSIWLPRGRLLSCARLAGLQDSEIYLLDDVLASVDAHVAAWIIDHAICGPMLRRKTCIMCTHSAALAQRADRVLHMRAGSIDSDHSPGGARLPISQASAGGQVRRLHKHGPCEKSVANVT